jgi:hypothetical protein
MHKLPAGKLTLEARQQTCRQGCAIPEAQFRQVGQEVTIHVEVDTLADQQPLDAVDVAGAFTCQGQQLTVQMALIFGRQAGHLHHAPHSRFAGMVAQEMVSSFSTSRRSVLAFLPRRLTSMLAESTTRLVTCSLSRKRCSQKPSRPAS